MELLIFSVFFTFFLVFLVLSLKLERPYSYAFTIMMVIMCMILGINLITEGIDITFCGMNCAVTNYQNIYIQGLGTMIFALTLFFAGVSIYEGFTKKGGADYEVK